ncbi:relaxase domain-containing protein [Streptomyces sp. A5-4]|uniref:relaxase domain-containing protein n=1 Tax=Streptomyces sp. A5-4 TaxID=3384771 RepID=UPI003DA95F33
MAWSPLRGGQEARRPTVQCAARSDAAAATTGPLPFFGPGRGLLHGAAPRLRVHTEGEASLGASPRFPAWNRRCCRTPRGSRRYEPTVPGQPASACVVQKWSGGDLVFRAPGSVQILWAPGSPMVRKVIESAHTRMIASIVDVIETELLIVRRGKDSTPERARPGMIAARFRHHESRDGSPLLQRPS